MDYQYLGGGFKYFIFSPLPGEMIQIDLYFSNGLKPPTRYQLIRKTLDLFVTHAQVEGHGCVVFAIDL